MLRRCNSAIVFSSAVLHVRYWWELLCCHDSPCSSSICSQRTDIGVILYVPGNDTCPMVHMLPG